MHIHSASSNDKKKNDYEGEPYSAEKLLQVLNEKGVELFSVTDHNRINKALYENLDKIIAEQEEYQHMNYVVGVELDVFDETVHDNRFHVLCLFESRNTDSISAVVEGFKYAPEHDDAELPSIKDIVEAFADKKIYEIIYIPHFNNKKSQGLPSDSKRLEEMNRLYFNGYEDINNSAKLSESLEIYLQQGLDDFPFIAFSDCHNLDVYPFDKKQQEEEFSKEDKYKEISCILGNIRQPFKSIKSAFEEPRLRISIPGVENMRSQGENNKSIQHIIHQGNKLEMSPYLNTIIGPFGSGKSLLMNKIEKGTGDIDSKYESVVPEDEDFNIVINNKSYNSLNEAKQTGAIDKTVKLKQDEKLLFADKQLKVEYMEDLANRLNFTLPHLETFHFKANPEDITNKIVKLEERFSVVNHAYAFNYQTAFSSEEQYYHIPQPEALIEQEKLDSYEKKLDKYKNVEELTKMNIANIKLFNETEIKQIKNVRTLIEEKMDVLLDVQAGLSRYHEEIKKVYDKYDTENDYKTNKTARDDSKTALKDFSEALNELNNCLRDCEQEYNDNVFKELKETEDIVKFDKYRIICGYNIDVDKEYESLHNRLYSQKSQSRTLIGSLMKSIKDGLKLKGNQPFEKDKILTNIKKHFRGVEELFNEKNLKYDLKTDEGTSILDLSPGQRSQEMLIFAFKKIEKDMIDGYKTIVLVDQPENNMDSQNVKELVVDKIRETKLQDTDNNLTYIFVTHNANVCITADSENIIIAKREAETKFNYENGCIENRGFMKRVCDLLEGGEEALRARATKYHVNIHKKVGS